MQTPVPDNLAGERADRIVAVLAGVSRALARRLVESGAATFDGGCVDPKQRLAVGTLVAVEVPETDPSLVSEAVAFEVRYEDRHLAVVDKPAGVVVHPGAGRREGTLAAGILHRWPQVRGVGDEQRWGIVHRLDRDTSGLLVVALDTEALVGLRDAVRQRRLERTYRALVEGIVESATGTIDAPLGRDPRHPTRFRIDPEGRHARTHYRRLMVWPVPARSLLEVRLETGRTHQIRVHLATIGHPVVADGAYGRGVAGHRVWLHSTRLAFDHPLTGERIDVESPIPEDLQGVLDALGRPDADTV